jgi:hypothetical protein
MSTANQKRNQLARRIIKGVRTLLVELKDLEDDIRQLWVEFDNLPKGAKILGCSTKKEFCEQRLDRTPRAIRYMLDGGNHKRGETVSPLKDDREPELPTELDDDEPLSEAEERKLHEQRERWKQERSNHEARKAQQRAQDEVIRNFARLMVKEGRRALATKYHPDKGGKAEDMVAINEAEQRVSRLIDNNWNDSFIFGLFRGAA